MLITIKKIIAINFIISIKAMTESITMPIIFIILFISFSLCCKYR